MNNAAMIMWFPQWGTEPRTLHMLGKHWPREGIYAGEERLPRPEIVQGGFEKGNGSDVRCYWAKK
jgi:hypothetical protein